MKPARIIILFVSLITAVSFAVSCSKVPDPVNEVAYVKVAEVSSAGSSFNVQFFAKDSLFVGYNKVFFKITEKSSGQQLSQAKIALYPLMDMGTFKHACPVENPAETVDQDGYFGGVVLFSMPGTGNSWSLAAKIEAKGKQDSVNFPISKVVATNPVRKIVVIDSLSNGQGGWIITKYPVSLVPPDSWKVGINTFEITAHTMASMMSFPPVADFTVEITPEMPSMGHGSPNNVNPVHTANGHYVGQVNFTMTGAWRINMVFKRGGRTIGRNAWFDINF